MKRSEPKRKRDEVNEIQASRDTVALEVVKERKNESTRTASDTQPLNATLDFRGRSKFLVSCGYYAPLTRGDTQAY